MKKILVTGAGALLGQGMLRCLQHSNQKYRVITADPDVYATGHALADVSYVIPMVSASNYMIELEQILKKEDVDIILIGTDVELPILAEHQSRLEETYNLKVVVSNSKVIEIANDKWLTAEFLRKNNFPYPQSALTTDKDGMDKLAKLGDYPYIAKPKDGARSKGLEIIRNQEQLEHLMTYPNKLVVQEMIGEEEGEFTTGCVVVDGSCKAVVSLTRDLRDGNTWRAKRDGDSPYDAQIATIAEKLGAEGPVNFQYRIRNGEPVIFEINCRFSGTTPLRMIFGFNEVEALLAYYLDATPIESPDLKSGTVLRTFSDIFVSNERIEEFKSSGSTSTFENTYIPFKRN